MKKLTFLTQLRYEKNYKDIREKKEDWFINGLILLKYENKKYLNS